MKILTALACYAKDGFHGVYLLVFTILIWIVFAVILSSSPNNHMNRWCFATGMLCSLGTLKEYIFYELGPILIASGIWRTAFAETLYSVLSAIFYYLSMPTALVFGLYYCHAERTIPRLFPRHRLLCYLPAAVLAIVFPCTQTLQFQSLTAFCLSVAVYDWLYGFILTAVMLHALHRERLTANHRQRVLVAVSTLLPLWFWLISAFPYHALGIHSFGKMWQMNLIVLIFILFFLIYNAFHEGIWGLRFQQERYDWSTGEKVMQSNAHYISHALKNDLAKIAWCTELLSQQGVQSQALGIIKNAIEHLNGFLQHTQLYSNRIEIHCEFCDIEQLFKQILASVSISDSKHAALLIHSCDKQPLYCDEIHLEEVLRNLINNALDAIPPNGTIQLSYQYIPSKRRAIISVKDNGCGIEHANMQHLAEPFFQPKRTTTWGWVSTIAIMSWRLTMDEFK